MQNTSARKNTDFEPLSMEMRQRTADEPAGLKNLGNSKYTINLFISCLACYFNSLMQTLFFLPNIQEKIINFDVEG